MVLPDLLAALAIAVDVDAGDENAAAALLDPQYPEGLEAYDRELARRNDPVWEKDYMQSAAGGRGA